MKSIMHQRHTLTPNILSSINETCDETTATQALDGIYALMALRLTDMATVKRIESLPTKAYTGDNVLLALFDNDTTLITALAQTLSTHTHLPPGTAITLLQTGTPLIYDTLKQMAGTKPLTKFLIAQEAQMLEQLPAWLLEFLPQHAKSTAQRTSDTPNDTASHAQKNQTPTTSPTATADNATNKSHFFKLLGRLVMTLVLASLAWLGLKQIQQNPKPIATPDHQKSQPTHRQPATLYVHISPAGELATANAHVGSQMLGEQLRQALNITDPNQLQLHLDDDTAKTMSILPYLSQVLSFAKKTPDMHLAISDKTVLIASTNEHTARQLHHDLSIALPDDFVVAIKPLTPNFAQSTMP